MFDGRPVFGVQQVLRPLHHATLTEPDGLSWEGLKARRGYRTSATTRPTPAPVMPTARAAAVDRSRTRPRTNGPRSLMVTTTLRPPWLPLRRVPNGRERCAAVSAF